MIYSEDEKKELFDKICYRIIEGESVRAILRDKNLPNRQTFYNWLNDKEHPERVGQYARACEVRADNIFDEIFEIADNNGDDYEKVDLGEGVVIEKVNTDHIQRSKLRIDARKWALSKMNPKKYGEKLDIESGGKSIVGPMVVKFVDGGESESGE
jgi:hypothetical protein